MGWLQGFTITILCVVLITSVCDALMPEGNLSKFVRLVLGLVVMVTLVGAAIGVTKIDFNDVFALEDTPAFDKQNAALEYNRQLETDFKNRIEQNIKEYIYQQYGVQSTVEALVQTDESYNITGIDSLRIQTGFGPDQFSLRHELANLYGIDINQIIVGQTPLTD